MTIPPLVRSPSVAGLNRARFLQPFADATGGRIARTGGSDSKVGGQLVHRDRLYGTAYVYYDAGGTQAVSHWTRSSTSLTSGRAGGLYRVGRVRAGMVSGYLAEIPREWQGRLGGPAITGNCCLPIISRTSFGPAAFAFDPTALGRRSPVAAAALVYYPEAHQAIGRWDDSWRPARGVLFNGSTTVRGAVFPAGSRSLLFFGTQGTGRFCYGEGTSDRSLDRRPAPGGTIYCYDPDDSSKGTHAYPYTARVWAYDARDLAAVRNGRRRPWQVRPYATWALDLPFGSARIGGAAYDPRTRRIYVSQQFGEGSAPVIHGFALR